MRHQRRTDHGWLLGLAIIAIWAIALKIAADHLDHTVPLPIAPATADTRSERVQRAY